MKKVTYRKKNDYYIPNLALYKDDYANYHIGKYGHLRLNYIRNYKKGLYTELMLNGRLPNHLADIDKEANKLIKAMVNELVKQNNVDEKLKQNDQLEWVKLMNNFKNSAEEIVLKELIYN